MLHVDRVSSRSEVDKAYQDPQKMQCPVADYSQLIDALCAITC